MKLYLSLIGIFFTGYAETKSHIRHLHTDNAYHRSTRADKVSNSATGSKRLNGEPPPDRTTFLQRYSHQHEQLTLKCEVNINFTTSIWLKDGQIVQTVFIDNSKRASGHRFLVDSVGDLLIDTVRLEDDGRWQCEAEDAQGFVVTAKPIHLTVLGKFILFHIITLVGKFSALT